MKKTSNGWSMIGMCTQWLVDERLSVNEQSVYTTILRHSFGYRHRWCYVDYNKFTISNRNTIKKTVDSLVEKKIISCTHTFKTNGHRGKNEYRIMKPMNHIKNFVFIKDVESKIKGKQTDEETEELGW